MEDFTVHDEDDPEVSYCHIGNTRFFDQALLALSQAKIIELERDPFGPALIIPIYAFFSAWEEFAKTNPIYGRYERSGRSRKWLDEALSSLDITENNLNIDSRDYDAHDDEWRPIPVERESAEVKAVIEALDDATEKIRSDNGYSSTKSKERNYVLDSLATFSKRLKEGATISWPYVRQFAVDPMARALKTLGKSVTGIAIEAAKAKLKEWLVKYGWPFG